jgi:LacI family transcriptional regulator
MTQARKKKPMPRPPSSTRASTSPDPQLVTLEMVAEQAKVSSSTVSRILNGTAAVSEAKRLAVTEAIRTLGFVPNPVARGLAGGRTLSIGIITQSIDSPFYGGALRGIEDELDKAGYSSLFVSGHWNAAEEERCIATLLGRRVDGIIVLTGRLSDTTLRKCAERLPIVVTGRRLRAPNLVSLSFDNFEGGVLATDYLLGLGHRKIAFITGDAKHPDANERLRGYRAALAKAKVAFDPALVVPGLFHEESGLLAVEKLLDNRQRFTALFAANDQMALGASLGLHRHGIRIPEDVSVVGFDDLLASRYASPPLTTIHHPAYELGQLSASAMIGLLRGNKAAIEVPRPRVVVRESTAPLKHN